MLNFERRFEVNVPPHEYSNRHCVTAAIPGNHLRIQIIPTLLSSLREQQRHYTLWVSINGLVLFPQPSGPNQNLPPHSSVFEAQLVAEKVNQVEVSVAAALPKGQLSPTGETFEVETISVLLNVVRN